MRINVVLPTRGLVFTEVEEALERERVGHDVKIFRSHNLRIPDGHNELTKQALLDNPDYLWYIEEDTVPPTGALAHLLATDADISCIDYGVSGWGCVTATSEGKILWCGLGCTLVKAKVFENWEAPWFRTDKTLRLNDWTWQELPKDYIENKNYGGLDIWFCCEARRRGFTIGQVEGECDHLRLENIGQVGVNGGLHTIVLKAKISNKQILTEGGDL